MKVEFLKSLMASTEHNVHNVSSCGCWMSIVSHMSCVVNNCFKGDRLLSFTGWMLTNNWQE